MLNLKPHDPTPECNNWHCYSHHVDEEAANPYRICFECNHVYPTAKALRKAYRKGSFRALGLWRMLITRRVKVSKIFFCPECLHDF